MATAHLNITGNSSGLNTATSSAASNLNKMGNAVSGVVGQLSKVTNVTNAVRAQVDRTNQAINGMNNAFKGMIASTVVREIYTVTNEIWALKSTMEAVTGSAEVAEEKFAFLIKTVRELGTDLTKSGKGYADLLAASRGIGLETGTVEKLFVATSKALLVVNADALKVEGAFRALVQMMSKGKISAEELRQQFAEHIPGGFQTAARAMKVSTAELEQMIKKGIDLSTFFGALATQLEKDFGGGMERALQSPRVAFNRFITEAKLAIYELGEILAPGFGEMMGKIATTIRTDVTPAIKDLEDAANSAFNIIEALFSLISATFSTLGQAAINFGQSMASLASMAFDTSVIEDWGDYFGYLFEVTIPTGIYAIAPMFRVMKDQVLGEMRIMVEGMSAIMDYWLAKMENVWIDFKILALNAYKAINDGASEALTTLANMYVARFNELKGIVNYLLPEQVEFSMTPNVDLGPAAAETTGLTQEIATLTQEQEKNTQVMSESEKQLDVLRKQVDAYSQGNYDAAKAEVEKYQAGLESDRIAHKQAESTKNSTNEIENYSNAAGRSAEETKNLAKEQEEYIKRLAEASEARRKGLLALQDYENALTDEITLAGLMSDAYVEYAAKLEVASQKQKIQRDIDEATATGKLVLAAALKEVLGAWEAETVGIENNLVKLKKVQEQTQTLESFYDDLGTAVGEAFGAWTKGEDPNDFLKSLIETIQELIVQLLIVEPIAKAIKDSLSSFKVNISGSTAGSSLVSSLIGAFFETGGVVNTPSLAAGVYSSPTVFPMKGTGMKAFASGTGLLGEAGPEAVLPLTRINGDLGVKAQTAPMNVTVNTLPGQSAEVTQDSNGNVTIDVIRSIIADDISRGGSRVSRALDLSYTGLRRNGR